MWTISLLPKMYESHLKHLEITLERLSKAGLKAKPANFVFAKSTITFLGHEISVSGISPDKKKVMVVQLLPLPHVGFYAALRGFTGLMNYFRRFIENYPEISEPLVQLTNRNHPFVWAPSKKELSWYQKFG